MLRDIRRVVSRKRRRRRLQILAVLAVLIVGGTAAYLNLPNRNTGSTVTGSTVRGTATASPGFAFVTQRTALFQVRGADGRAVASALLAYDSDEHTAAVIQLPNRVAVGEGENDNTLFADTVRGDGGPLRARRALADLMGVRIDDSWVLDQAAFSRLVDRLGGITADVDVNIVSQRAGSETVVLPKGSARKLDGAHAAAMINYRPPGKDELTSLPRIQNVLKAVLAKLPEGAARVAALENDLGRGSELSDVLQVPRLLDGIRAEQAIGGVSFSTLPVLAVASGGQLSYRVEPVATTRLVSQVLAGSAHIGKPGQGNRVLAYDGSGRTGFGATMRGRIGPAGFALIDARKESPGRTQTTIIIFDTTSQSTIRASQLASALGLPKAPVHVAVRTQNIADLIVHVGSDFKP